MSQHNHHSPQNLGFTRQAIVPGRNEFGKEITKEVVYLTRNPKLARAIDKAAELAGWKAFGF